MHVLINRSGYLEHDVARGILKFQCKTWIFRACKSWEFRATSCSRHPDLFIDKLSQSNNHTENSLVLDCLFNATLELGLVNLFNATIKLNIVCLFIKRSGW